MKQKQFSLDWGGKQLTVEVGKLAPQASGSCTVTLGGTTILATAMRSDRTREVDYFPLMVDFEERFYAAGKIKGSRFIKREGRPSDDAILTARVVDRGIRPLFDDRTRNEVHVVITALSFDGENDPDVPAIIGASIALSISEIPWDGPIAGVRVGRIDGAFIANPSYDERKAKSDCDVMLSGTHERLLMLDVEAREVPEDVLFDATKFGQKHLIDVMKFIEKIISECGKEKQAVAVAEALADEVVSKADAWIAKRLSAVLFASPLASKHERAQALAALQEELRQFLAEEGVDEAAQSGCLKRVKPAMEQAVMRSILDEEKRVDGRGVNDIRLLAGEVGLLPRTHGSGLFARGETQVLSVVTLGSPGMVQTLDTMEESGEKRYMHHYNFPPYSVGETGFMRGPGRREIGHGALAEKALEPVLPPQEEFPYAIRVVSEVLSSNGSSSMASTCGSTLALMDAGVPIKKPVAGIAMGLASEDDFKRWRVIADLQDLEDGAGGMDFKIAGTPDGITAIQLDTKTKGLPQEVVEDTFKKGRAALTTVLEHLQSVIAEPRPELSPYAPRITSLMIPVDRIRDVIGPGGKIINEIIAETGVQIDIEDSGLVMVTSTDAAQSERAVQWIKDLTRAVAVGETFEGPVTRIFDFGAMVQILPNQEGLVHISELADWHVGKVEDIVKTGDRIPVKVISIDDQGRVNLSLKAMKKIERPEGYEARPREDRRPFNGSSGNRRRPPFRRGR